MIVETSLENFKGLTPERRSGNTTRLIDHTIQLLFQGKIVLLCDHWDNGNHQNANEDFRRRLLDRLQEEHQLGKKDIKLQLVHGRLDVYQISLKRNKQP